MNALVSSKDVDGPWVVPLVATLTVWRLHALPLFRVPFLFRLFNDTRSTFFLQRSTPSFNSPLFPCTRGVVPIVDFLLFSAGSMSCWRIDRVSDFEAVHSGSAAQRPVAFHPVPLQPASCSYFADRPACVQLLSLRTRFVIYRSI